MEGLSPLFVVSGFSLFKHLAVSYICKMAEGAVDASNVTVTESMSRRPIGQVTQLYIYPVKSCGPVPVKTANTTYSGMKFAGQELIRDRCFMVVAPTGSHLHQRVDSQMALISVNVKDVALEFTAPGMDNLLVQVPTETEPSNLKQCNVWSQPIGGADCGDEAAEWFSKYLNKPARLVYAIQDQYRRRTDERGNTRDKIQYQDDMPFQLLGESSVEDLNTKLEEKVTTNHFRANIIVNTTVPYEEDEVKTFEIGAARFVNMRRTTRCLMTTVDPTTGIKSASGEPLKTMATYRIFPEVSLFSPCLGTFLLADNESTISVGDTVYAVS